MPAMVPGDCDILVSQAISAGDTEAAMALYESGAVFVAEPGKVVTGLEAIREVIGTFIATKPQIDIEVEQVIQSGDIALLHARYTLKGTGPDGTPTEMSGRSAEVVRRQDDGSWRFIIDNPFGTGQT